MNTPIALVISATIIGAAIFFSTPRYEIHPIQNSKNPAAWKVDKFTGNLALCATAAGENTESGCSVTLKQF